MQMPSQGLREATEASPSISRIAELEAAIAGIVKGKPDVIRLAVVSILAGGHVLIEDVPGVGKTTLARTLAGSLGLDFQRIQFTSDLLPSDIIGISLFNQKSQSFEFSSGPIFANVVLADEINRATPKTQSALLEAMSEQHVSVDRERFALPKPFLVIATQNPVEYRGTFPLPESQLDRFLMSLRMGYPPRRDERELLQSGGVDDLVDEVEAVFDRPRLLALQKMARSVRVADKLADYMISLAESTRQDGKFTLPVSTRGVQGLYRATQALAVCEGRDFAVPDDVQRLAVPVLAHRVLLQHGADIDESRDAIEHLVANVPVPV